MKKRVCSVLLAAVLCVTMLSVVALATECTDGNHTYTGKYYVANANGINHSLRCDKCDYVDTSSSSQHCDNGSNNNAKDGKCDFCSAELAVSFNDSSRSSCATTLQAAFDYVKSENSSTETKLFSMKDIADAVSFEGSLATLNLAGNNLTGSITVNGGTLTITNTLDSKSSTVSTINVTGGTVKIEGNLTVTTLKISANAKVELSGGTYGKITGVTDKNTLLGPGYVFDTDGKTVVEAPIKSVTASVTGHNNAKYGYTAEQAPVLTAAITPDNVMTGVTYQWYKVNGSKKTAIDNATAQTYTVETGLNAGDYDYCCTATVGTYSLTSGNVKVIVAKADGPQLGTINVNQVYNDTASKTINIYESIGTALDQLKADAGTLRFHSGTYSPENTIKSGWDVDVNTGAITYQLAEGLSVGQTITITMQVGYNEAYSKNHEDATVTVNITLTKITPTGTPNYTPITSSGKTLADANLNANNNAFSVPGEVRWVGESDGVLADDTPVEKGVAYHWEFRPTEGDKYERLTGSIILWTESGSGVVIITPSQSGESTPASNPNTGAAHVGQPLPGLALLALAALCLYAGTRRF